VSLERARKTFNLEPVEGGFALSEYIVHPEFLKKVSGMDPFKVPRESHARAYKELGVDFVAALPDAAIGLEEGTDTLALNDEGAKTTRWGTGPGSVWVSTLPFKTVDEVLEYDPFSCKAGTYPYGMAENPHKSVDEIAAALQRNMESQWKYSKDDFMIAGGNYFVLFHYFVSTFGYDLFCEAAYIYPDQFRKLIEKFAELSYKISLAWAKTSIEAFICHDDIAGTHGTIFPPDWLREHIFSRYREILEPIHKAGKKILFFSDGNYTSVLDDLEKLPFDGFVFEPHIDLKMMINRFGGKRCLMGNADVRTLTFGTKQDIRDEVDRCVSLGSGVPGYILFVSGHLPQGIPFENIRFYFEEVARRRNED
jgi:hypothetical protein